MNDYGLQFASYYPLTYSAGTGFSVSVKTGVGKFVGILVAVSYNGTLAVYDSTSASGTAIIPAFSAGSAKLYNFGMPVLFTSGLYIYSGGSIIGTAVYF